MVLSHRRAAVVALSSARAQGPDDQYIQIYNLIQEADKLVNDLQPSDALPKYLEAQTALQRFQKGYPQWNPKVIRFPPELRCREDHRSVRKGFRPRGPCPSR